MEIIKNKKAYFQYQVEDTYEAGIVLLGTEVKSLRGKKVNIQDSYAVFKGRELFLINCLIEPYSHGTHANHEPLRTRKLLLHKKELLKIKNKIAQKGYVCIPLSCYFKNGKVKFSLGLGKGKKVHDKRETIKNRDIQRDMERERGRY